jgi:hypothetical protein
MKIEGIIFAIVAVFFAMVDLSYWYLSKDPTGTTALALSTGLAFLIGFYLLMTARRITPRPEDRPDAEVEEGAGEYGFFSPHSWWPLAAALSAAVVCIGIVFGWWIAIIGAMMLAFSTMGFVFEYYRGPHTPR